MGYKAGLRVWRGDAGSGSLEDYRVEVNEGEVVLDVLHRRSGRASSGCSRST
jgi:succinate dehydrogenase / fumarate reductase iron-sulfur subunit